MKKYLLLLITILFLTSCSKWLDVQPRSQVSQDELFRSEDGFKEAINGLYTRCAQPDLYGGELLIGFPEAMVQNYTIGLSDPFNYRQTSQYNFKDPDLITRKDNVWKGLYNVIANCNLILGHVDKQQDILTPESYALVKGEALAMRAWCHFDALRLFAPIDAGNKGVPYATDFTSKTAKMYTVGETTDLILKDLLTAKSLLATTDPVVLPGYKIGYSVKDSSTEDQRELFLQNRRHRLNFYAVCGALARVYLYKGDRTNALNNALEVINANKFPWTRQSDFLNPDNTRKDRILYKELIFAFYIPNTSEYLRQRFRSGEQSLYISQPEGRNLYETGGAGGEDFRFKQWFTDQATTSTAYMRIEKYTRDPDNNLHPQMAPAIRLSEMYYIAAECTFDADPARAWDYFNTVRLNRGIGLKINDPSRNVLIQELIKEMRKEYYAEGQLFYMYKRLNYPVTGQNGTTIPAGNNIFVLPVPDDEIAYGNR